MQAWNPVENKLPDNLLEITNQDNTYSVVVDELQYRRWQQGEGLIQNMFPNLNADDREFLMTGITPEQWDAMFSCDLDG